MGEKGSSKSVRGDGMQRQWPPFEPKGMDRWTDGCVLWVRCLIEAGAATTIHPTPSTLEAVLIRQSVSTPDPITERDVVRTDTQSPWPPTSSHLALFFIDGSQRLLNAGDRGFTKHRGLASPGPKRSSSSRWPPHGWPRFVLLVASVPVGLHPSLSPHRRPPCT